MLSKYKLNQLYFKDTQFANLMTRRIFNVLLIANPYDAFMLEHEIISHPEMWFWVHDRWKDGRERFAVRK